ncbi:MAG: DUF1330 domain-containing protein [Proteobacteria bacterium]|nr:DUF1330 domain-containing protein [Pseudomonadota bacterium]
MAAYLIVQVDITDPDTFEEYKKQVPGTLAAYGGEYIVRGGEIDVLEGEWPMPRLVIIRFSSMEQARKWYRSPEYEGPHKLREASARANLVLVDGV